MHKKALTVAIAGALAIPMAAQAVDVTLSGHVNRALFINDSDASTGASVKDNGSSGTRIRVKGTGEMMDGGSAGVLLEYSAGSSLGLRYADVWFSGDYGKISIGQGDQGGEGSVYKGAAAVLGTGHGQDTDGAGGDYYTSLDGGAGRNERLRYDSPAVGPVSAAISVGNGDQVSAGISLSQEFGGTSFNAGVGTIQWGGSDKSTISGSAGVSLASGISISGAWGKGSNYTGATDPGTLAVAMGATQAHVPAWDGGMEVTLLLTEEVEGDFDGDSSNQDDIEDKVTLLQNQITNMTMEGTTDGATALTEAQVDDIKRMYNMAIMAHMCVQGGEGAAADLLVTQEETPQDCTDSDTNNRFTYAVDEIPASAAIPAGDDTVHVTDPSFFQVAVSYAFGDTSVGVSWYQSNDLQRDGSELTAIGIGVDHNLPKLGTNVYAAAQNYTIEDGSHVDTDATVIMIGARVKF